MPRVWPPGAVARGVSAREGFAFMDINGWEQLAVSLENSPSPAILAVPKPLRPVRGTTFVNDYTEVVKHDKFEEGAHQEQITTRHTADVR